MSFRLKKTKKQKLQRFLHVIKELLYCNISTIYEAATVNNSIPAFPNDILLRKPIRRMLQIPQSKPMAPTQVRELWETNPRRRGNGRILSILPPRIARATFVARVRAPSPFALVRRGASLAQIISIARLAPNQVRQHFP